MRALLAAALLAAACSDGNAPAPPSDMAMAASGDFSTAGRQCGVDNVLQACGGSCAICLYVVGGVCARPCATAASGGCPSPQTCHALGGDGGTGQYQIVGACSGVDGYCG